MLSRCRCSSSTATRRLSPQAAYNSHTRCYKQSSYINHPFALQYFSSTVQTRSREIPDHSNSVFSNTTSPWDQVFRDVDSYAAPSNLSSNMETQRRYRRTRQAMTARESSVLNEMFEMIFDAASAQESSDPSATSPTGGSVIGVGGRGVDDLIGKLRRYPKRLIQSTELNSEVDRRKEKIDLFTTDRELLEWVQDTFFEESRRYEAEARDAISQAAKTGVYGKLPMLQPPAYPHLLAHIMRTFRDKFDDPHLALAIFEHARRLSIASYVFGCSSEAYHELLETRWKCFQDLRGVKDALVEMKVNGVKVDPRTRQLAEKIRKQVGERQLAFQGADVGSEETWNILLGIERLVASAKTSSRQELPKGASKAVKTKRWDVWKTERLEDKEGDEWGFDRWDVPDSEHSGKPQRERKLLT